jgi:hypothetical protein
MALIPGLAKTGKTEDCNMTKYTAFNMTGTFGTTAFVCLNSADVNMAADIYTAACAGETWKSRVAGANEASFTINYTLDSASTAAFFNALLPRTTGTFTLSTNGTYSPTYSAVAVIESHNMSDPVEGIVTGTIMIGVNGSLTIA